MTEQAIPAVFMRGGTSKAIMFLAADLPRDPAQWDDIFTAAMGTPDPYGRQLNGMGGGVSSLSKVCVIAPSSREDADIDYTFGQVLIRERRVDTRSNCGNMSSAVGPFAVDQGLVQASGVQAVVRIHNTNTGKIIRATFPLQDGKPRYDGDLAIPGVAGTGAAIKLDFLNPGGATTGKLLPTGAVSDLLEVQGYAPIHATMIDAANAAVFVRAHDLGLSGRELPDEIDANPALLAHLSAIRLAASVRMGIAPDLAAAAKSTSVPFIGFISPAGDAPSLTGEAVQATNIDLTARVMSSGQLHRALPLTVSLCTAVAARMAGSVVAEMLPAQQSNAPIRIGMPSGVLTVDADVVQAGGEWAALSGSFYRTARRLFEGRVWVP